MAEVNPPESIAGQMDEAFKRRVEELSGGSITIDLQCSAILGDEETLLPQLTKPDSTVQLMRISAFALTNYGCKTSALLTVPFTFADKAHFWRFATSSAASTILNEPYEIGIGVKGLFFGEEGFRSFFSTAPIASVHDFVGKRLRVSDEPIMRGMADGLQAVFTPVNFSDLYSAQAKATARCITKSLPFPASSSAGALHICTAPAVFPQKSHHTF